VSKEWHDFVSFYKSVIRILGYIALPWNIGMAAIALIVAEILGILEEL